MCEAAVSDGVIFVAIPKGEFVKHIPEEVKYCCP